MAACGHVDKDSEYFNGEIRLFDDSRKIVERVCSTTFPLRGPNFGEMAVYDSLIIYWNPKLSDHFFNIFNVDTGEQIGSFCSKGRGPREAISVNPVFQLFEKKGDLMTLLDANNEGKLFFWNISRSVEQAATRYDTIASYSGGAWFRIFRQSDSTMLASVVSQYLSDTKMTTPSYVQRTIFTDEMLKEYLVYRMSEFENKKTELSQYNYFYTFDAMKPDGTKIVQAMSDLPQINIIDIQTGEIVGYRLQEEPGFSRFETDMNPLMVFYNSVQVDDNYIYATYWGGEQWNVGGREVPDLRTIHIYDWSGNHLYELITDRAFFRISLDPVRRRLYTTDLKTNEVSYVDLNKLGLL
jgi:hypothetical protein